MTSTFRFVVNGLLLLALVCALGLAALGWHELPNAAVWGRLLIGAGLAGAVAVCVLFFLPLDLRANLTLTGVVSVLTLWVASWILHEPPRSWGEQRQRDLQAAARKAGAPFDTRTPLEVIDDLRERGIDAYPPLSAWSLYRDETDAEHPAAGATDSEYTLMPLAGRSRTVTVPCNENGEYMIVETDRYGFNNPDEVHSRSSPVLLLGDSFTFGYCVRPGYDTAGRLRAEGVELVNLGYPGSGTLLQLAQLREYGPLAQPRVILWFYYHGNDLRDLTAEYQEPALRRYLDPEHRQNLPARQGEIDALWADHLDLDAVRAAARSTRPSLRDVLLLQPLRARLGSGRVSPQHAWSPLDSPLERFEETMDQLIAEAEQLGASLHFVFLPTYGQFVDPSLAPGHADEVFATVRARGLPVVDFKERLLETGDPLHYFPFRLNAHYTEEGYEMLVELILQNVPVLREILDEPAAGADESEPGLEPVSAFSS